MENNIYTYLGIIIWLVIFRLIILIPGITEQDVLMGACAFLLTKMEFIENNIKDN